MTEGSPKGWKRWLRSGLAGVVGVIAVVGLLASVTAVWAKRTLFDSERFADKMDTVVQDPAVVSALSVYVTDQVFTLVDVEGALTTLAPNVLEPIVPVFVAGAKNAVQGRVEEAFSTEGFATVFHELIERTHRAAMKVLQGDGLFDGVTVSDDAVTLNLLPLITIGLEGLQRLGLFTNLTMPQFTADGDPAAQIAQLESITGRDLADDFGQLVVFRGEAVTTASAYVESAQQALAFAKRALVALILVTVVAFVGAVLLAQRRRRAALVLLLASVGALFVARAIVNRITEELPSLVTKPGARAALSGAVESFADGYFRAVSFVALLAVIGALVLFLTGSSGVATKVRGSGGSLGGFVQGHRDATAVVVAGAGVGLLLVAGVNWLTLLLALAAFAGAAWLGFGSKRSEPNEPASE